MTSPREQPDAGTIVVVGPAASQVGGMAAVVEQNVGFDWAGRYRTVFFPTTSAPADRSESISGRLRRHFRRLHELDQTICRNRAAIVHLHTCSGFTFYRSVLDVFVAQRRSARAVLHIHGAAFKEFYAGAGRSRRLIRWALGRADRVIALSEAWGQEIRRMAPSARLAVIENAITLPRIEPPTPHHGPVRFLTMARMDQWKGIDDLLGASQELQAGGLPFELILAGPPGTAGDAATLNRKIGERQLDRHVRYVGPVLGENKSELLRWADVYVQPSHHEGMPLALLEALAHGLPVVATRVGAVPEVVTDQHEGLLVSPRRPAELAAAMGHLARDAARRSEMGRAARRLAETRFDLHRLRGDLLQLYDDLIAGPDSRARGTPTPLGERVRCTKPEPTAPCRTSTAAPS